MTLNDKIVLTYLTELLNPRLLETASLHIHKNAGLYNSIQIHVESNPYRNNIANDFLFARVRSTGKRPYISFNTQHAHLFSMFESSCFSVSSDPSFTRIDLQAFLEYDSHKALSKTLNEIFLASFNFPPFGCCSLYKQCSKEKHCLHSDLLYATACMYRKNLEQGKIFY